MPHPEVLCPPPPREPTERSLDARFELLLADISKEHHRVRGEVVDAVEALRKLQVRSEALSSENQVLRSQLLHREDCIQNGHGVTSSSHYSPSAVSSSLQVHLQAETTENSLVSLAECPTDDTLFGDVSKSKVALLGPNSPVETGPATVDLLRKAAATYVDSKYKRRRGEDPAAQKPILWKEASEDLEECTVAAQGSLTLPQYKTALERWQSFVVYSQAKTQNAEKLAQVNEVWKEAGEQADPGLLLMRIKGAATLDKEARDARQKNEGNPLLKPRLLTRATVNLSQGIRWPVVHPNCKKRVLWDIFGILLLVHDMMMVPLQAFNSGTTGLPEGYTSFRESFDIFSAIFWSGDIMVSFMTGYYTSDGLCEVAPMKVFRHYIRTWFGMDLCIVTVDWVAVAIGLGSSSGYMRLGKTVSRVMRVVRLLRFVKMNASLNEMLSSINSEYILTVVGLAKSVVGIVIVNHYIACFWYALSRMPKTERTWSKKFLKHTASMTYAYATSLHWALTQFTPASMEVVPQNEYERFFTALIIIVALVAFSSFVSSITQAMTHLRLIKAKQAEQEAQIRRYFAENKITRQLAGQTWQFLRKNRITAGRRIREGDIKALTQLPMRIRDALRQEAYSPILVTHPLFARYSCIEPDALHRICACNLRELTLTPHAEFMKDCIPTTMFFVQFGAVEYNTEDGLTISVLEGSWACEAVLWVKKPQLTTPFNASVNGSDLMLLNAADFIRTAQQFPGSFSDLAGYAEHFVTVFNDSSAECKDEDVLFNDPVVIEYIVNLSLPMSSPLGINGLRKNSLVRGVGSLFSNKSSKKGSISETVAGSASSVDFQQRPALKI